VTPRLFRGWIVVGLGFLVMVLIFGTRFTLGLFIPGLTEGLGISIADVSLVIALSTLLSGLIQPLTGVIADHVGPSRVVLAGLVAMGVAFVGTGISLNYWQLMLFLGLASGLAFSAANLVILSALVSRWFDRYRGRALGFVTSGSKIGTLLVVPATGAGIVSLGWRPTLVILGLSMLALAPFIWRYMASDPADVGLLPDGDPHPTTPPPDRVPRATAPDWTDLIRAARTLAGLPAFWLLSLSLFGNGFMMNLVYMHLPSFVLQLGYGELMATWILALMGGVGIIGTIISGYMSDRISRKGILAVLYLSRTAATILLILYPDTLTLYLFTLIFGFLGFGAVAVTSTLTGDIFGRYSVGSVFGLIYVLHQVGGALGTYAGGLSVDLTGSYDAAFWLCVLVSALSAGFVIAIRAEPLRLAVLPRRQSA
jgi:MFS family permease